MREFEKGVLKEYVQIRRGNRVDTVKMAGNVVVLDLGQGEHSHGDVLSFTVVNAGEIELNFKSVGLRGVA